MKNSMKIVVLGFALVANAYDAKAMETKEVTDFTSDQEQKLYAALSQEWDNAWKTEMTYTEKDAEHPELEDYQKTFIRLFRNNCKKKIQRQLFSRLGVYCKNLDAGFQKACRDGNETKIKDFLNKCNLVDNKPLCQAAQLNNKDTMLYYFRLGYQRYNVVYAFVNNTIKKVTLRALLTHPKVIEASFLAEDDKESALLFTEQNINDALIRAIGQNNHESEPMVHYLLNFTFTPVEKFRRPNYIRPHYLQYADTYLESISHAAARGALFDLEVRADQERERRVLEVEARRKSSITPKPATWATPRQPSSIALKSSFDVALDNKIVTAVTVGTPSRSRKITPVGHQSPSLSSRSVSITPVHPAQVDTDTDSPTPSPDKPKRPASFPKPILNALTPLLKETH